jgi:hypothetical protein
VIDLLRYLPLKERGDAVAHLRRTHAGVVPDDGDHRDVDFGENSIAMRDTALADNRQTRRMPAATVNGRFNENSARDMGDARQGAGLRTA